MRQPEPRLQVPAPGSIPSTPDDCRPVSERGVMAACPHWLWLRPAAFLARLVMLGYSRLGKLITRQVPARSALISGKSGVPFCHEEENGTETAAKRTAPQANHNHPSASLSQAGSRPQLSRDVCRDCISLARLISNEQFGLLVEQMQKTNKSVDVLVASA